MRTTFILAELDPPHPAVHFPLKCLDDFAEIRNRVGSFWVPRALPLHSNSRLGRAQTWTYHEFCDEIFALRQKVTYSADLEERSKIESDGADHLRARIRQTNFLSGKFIQLRDCIHQSAFISEMLDPNELRSEAITCAFKSQLISALKCSDEEASDLMKDRFGDDRSHGAAISKEEHQNFNDWIGKRLKELDRLTQTGIAFYNSYSTLRLMYHWTRSTILSCSGLQSLHTKTAKTCTQ